MCARNEQNCISLPHTQVTISFSFELCWANSFVSCIKSDVVKLIVVFWSRGLLLKQRFSCSFVRSFVCLCFCETEKERKWNESVEEEEEEEDEEDEEKKKYQKEEVKWEQNATCNGQIKERRSGSSQDSGPNC